MHRLQRSSRLLVPFLVLAFFNLSIHISSVQAAMIGTDAVVSQTQTSSDRNRLVTFLGRDDVRRQMESFGINTGEAKARIDALSDSEVTRLAGALDRLPAGADGFGAVIGAALIVFLVLLLTDILGVTHVFPFVNKR